MYRNLLLHARIVGVDVYQTMRFKIQILAAIRHDVVFVLARLERDAIGGPLEQIDGGRGVDRKHFRSYGGREPWVDFIECEKNVDRLRLERRQHVGKAGQIAAEKFARKHEQFAQQVEPLEHPVIIGKQRVVALEADLLQALGRRGTDYWIA